MKVTYEEKDYEIDFERALKLGVVKPVAEPIKVGQKYLQKASQKQYVLAIIGNSRGAPEMALIGIDNGIRWTDGVIVKNTTNVSLKEWKQITGDEAQAFELVK
jgi:hypothetical protein